MRVLDLFSGIGGFSLGLERAGMTTVAFCEIDPFCQKVLKKHWPNVPVFNDIRTLDYDGTVDLICGGFPCQPFSSAGKRKGKEDDRDLWPEMFRIIQKYKPTWVIGENVAGFINMELERTATDLEGEGYEVQAFLIPACAVNAPHQRNRIWIVAYSQSNHDCREARELCSQDGGSFKQVRPEPCGASAVYSVMADTKSAGLEKQQHQKRVEEKLSRSSYGSVDCGSTSHWATESSICRVVNGLPGRVHRLKALGNAVVPQIPEIIGRYIMEQKR